MTEFFTAILHLDPMAIVKAGGYIGIAILVFAESGVLLGIFFPGDSVLFVAGLLAAGGFLSFWPLVLIVVCAAIVGDSVGYWFGVKAGNAFFKRPDSRFFKQEYVTRTQKFFEKYGGRAIILARFVPIVRTIAPILAGVGTMHYRRFLSYNIFGGLLWGAGMVSLGYFLGSVIPNSEKYVFPITLIIVVISFFPIIANFVCNKKTVQS
ncbi:MAG: DedA family protein [Candidatus Kaiserbacteria bacterium]|nr:DedA family protein [Candidatus Kaiserbacteria bacterium]